MASGVNGLAIDRATDVEQPILAAMLQLYIHDFSGFFAGSRRGDLGDDGRYVPDIPLALWWQDPDRIPLLLRMDGRLAGFVLLGRHAYGGPVDRTMAEFFVVRKYRRTGLGTGAARAIFARYPGSWEAAVMRPNTDALAFWKLAVAGAPGLIALDVEDRVAGWDGSVLRFRIAAEA